MVTSKILSSARTTIPREVRKVLRLKAGDKIAYMIRGDTVILTKASSGVPFDPFVTFSEWDSEADRRAYRSL